jgi:biopolymer transport protein ExbD
MNLRNKSKSRNREEITIDLTPMIDVVFLLIIFFLITTTFQKERTINLNLAKSSSSKEMKKDDGITILIDKEGKYYFQKKETSLAKLKDILQNENRSNTDKIR